jgi:hypothetical protein
MKLGRDDMHVGLMTDGWLGLVRHPLHAVGLGERDAALEAGDAAHLDDVRLHHPHPSIDQVGQRRKRVRLLADGEGPMKPEDMMPIESDQAQMWTLGEDRTTVRLALPPLPPDGMPEPVRVVMDFDAETVDAMALPAMPAPQYAEWSLCPRP